MAKARMLHNKISTSSQVNKLSLPAKLLFTWMIAHADDDGRMKGDPACVKAKVVPMVNWSFKRIEAYLWEIKNAELIYYWKQKDEWFIEFKKWKGHQSIKADRYKPSDLPSFDDENGNVVVPENIQKQSGREPQFKIIESNVDKHSKIKFKKSELKNEEIADKKSLSYRNINSEKFTSSSNGKSVAFDTWKRLEPDNSKALQLTYLRALKLGLPEHKFGEFASEIEQDSNIRNRGAVFNKKVTIYLMGKDKVRK